MAPSRRRSRAPSRRGSNITHRWAVAAFALCGLVVASCGRAPASNRVVEQPLKPAPFTAPDFSAVPLKSIDPSDIVRGSVKNVTAISFPASGDRVRLVGYFFGDDGKRSKGVVLLDPSKDKMSVWFGLARRLMNLGYAVITFDYRGVGQSQGAANPANDPNDAKGALNVLRVSGVSRIAVVGDELGGTVAVSAASTWDGTLNSLVAIDAQKRFGPLDASGGHPFGDEALVLTTHGTSDIASLLPRATTENIPASAIGSGRVADRITAFLKKTLG